jgi:hypothetical protein
MIPNAIAQFRGDDGSFYHFLFHLDEGFVVPPEADMMTLAGVEHRERNGYRASINGNLVCVYWPNDGNCRMPCVIPYCKAGQRFTFKKVGV